MNSKRQCDLFGHTASYIKLRYGACAKVSPVFSCGTRIVRALCERIGESRSYGTGDIAEAMISALYMISASRMKGTDIISYLYRKYIILR